MFWLALCFHLSLLLTVSPKVYRIEFMLTVSPKVSPLEFIADSFKSGSIVSRCRVEREEFRIDTCTNVARYSMIVDIDCLKGQLAHLLWWSVCFPEEVEQLGATYYISVC
ncbi:unnamed protein product [Rodentolepis nana]|uniref:Uncharacterized protein n=1 Tax=Rodentolepis nana TaxID=102285 RepID=A0A3P7T4V6_RODNA|nr:unnamed protein product [Rodentolepis nana]